MWKARKSTKSIINSGGTDTSSIDSTVPALFQHQKAHWDDEMIGEIKNLTSGPDIPNFVPDFVISLATNYIKRGTLTSRQIDAYRRIHEILTYQGYISCPICERVLGSYDVNSSSSS